MPTHSIFCGACCGLHLPSDRLSHSGWSCLHMPTNEASCGSDLGLPKSSCGSGGGSFCSASFSLHWLVDKPSCGGSGTLSPHLYVPIDGTSHGGISDSPKFFCSSGSSWSSLHSALFALGSNTSGLVMVASTAPLAGSMLVVP